MVAGSIPAGRTLIPWRKRYQMLPTFSDEPYRSLLPILVDEIPHTVAACTAGKRICRLTLWYFDTCAPCAYFQFAATTEAVREQQRREIKGWEYLIWPRAGYGPSDDPPLRFAIPEEGSATYLLFEQAYDRLCRDDRWCNGIDKEFDRYALFARTVAYKLNELNWSLHCSVTDDFVVTAMNGTDCCDDVEDVLPCIPPARQQLLRERGLL